MSHGKHDTSKHRVKITVEKHDDRTAALARMRWRHVDVVGSGEAEIDPSERYPKRVGEELAVARALTHLTRQLFVTTAGDIESVTGEATSVRSSSSAWRARWPERHISTTFESRRSPIWSRCSRSTPRGRCAPRRCARSRTRRAFGRR